jgi:benzoylformate decarboxylase
VQLTEDPNVAAWAPQGTSAVGSIRLGVQDLLAREAPPLRERPEPRRKPSRVEPSSPMSTAFVLQTLAELRAADSIVVEEAPSARATMQAYLPIVRSETFYTMCSGGLGWSMPASVGIALARPGAKVIALIGDGSSMYSIQALWSAAQLKLAVAFIVLKNRRYAVLQEFAPAFGFAPGESLPGTELPDIDFVALARGMGCTGVNVGRAEELGPALTQALGAKHPTLVEVDVA